MRCTPLAVWTSSIASDLYSLKNILKQECEMTHSNSIVYDAIFVYTAAIHYLLNNPTDENRAVSAYNRAMEAANMTQSRGN